MSSGATRLVADWVLAGALRDAFLRTLVFAFGTVSAQLGSSRKNIIRGPITPVAPSGFIARAVEALFVQERLAE
jgi:hypothetical protein